MRHRYTLYISFPNRSTALIAATLALFTLSLIGMAGCNSKSPPTESPTPKRSVVLPTPQFVGNDSCIGCHPKIGQDHAKSRHAQTMRLASKQLLGTQFPINTGVSGFGYGVTEEQGILHLNLKQKPTAKVPLAYALGAGKNALTFICPYNEDMIIEARMSYHPNLKEWFITPGQLGKVEGAELVVVWEPTVARRCVRCHTTTQPTKGLIPNEKLFGVGCESCHGAGSNHVDTMRQTNKPPYYIDRKANLTGEQANELCGVCHRRTIDVPDSDKDMTQRFQPHGIAKSKCFQNSNNGLTCITCHDPHKDASTNHKEYSAICAKCHTNGVTPPAKLTRIAVCPKQPNGDCIPCHMPQKALRQKQGNISIQMADHFIRKKPPTKQVSEKERVFVLK